MLFRFVAASHERRSLGIASHCPSGNGAVSYPNIPAVSLLDRPLHHNNVVATDGEAYRMR